MFHLKIREIRNIFRSLKFFWLDINDLIYDPSRFRIYSLSSIVKPTRCINVSNLFYCINNLHVSDGLSVHHQELKTVHTSTCICQTDNCCTMYSL